MTLPRESAASALAAPGAEAVDEPLLNVDGLSIHFGGVSALDQVAFAIDRGQICGLIGPNGAGKTTLFNCLGRIYECDEGRIDFRGHKLLDHPRHEIVALGVGRTFQNLALFGSMTVLGNVLLGAHCRTRTSYVANMLRLPSVQREEDELSERALELLAYLGLEAEAERNVSDLAFGTRKRVEIARALMSDPLLLLLDEPAGGLNHDEVTQLANLIIDLRDRRGLTILLVEHHMGLVMRVSDKVVALNFGRKIADGTAVDVQRDPVVISAYLGGAN